MIGETLYNISDLQQQDPPQKSPGFLEIQSKDQIEKHNVHVQYIDYCKTHLNDLTAQI